MLGFENTKRFLLSDIRKIGQKKLLLLVKLKIHFLGLMLLVTLMVNQLLEVFYEKVLQKTRQRKIQNRKIQNRGST